MGYYINPPVGEKERFLQDYGMEVKSAVLSRHDFKSDYLPVCLVDNGFFTAAAIAYCKDELCRFLNPDGRPKKWYLVRRELLEPYLK